MNQDIRGFIIKQLEKKQALPKENIDDYQYMAAGHIDSISLMKFVVEIEDEFNIEIASEDIVSAQFQRLGGVVEIIQAKINAVKQGEKLPQGQNDSTQNGE